MKVKKFKAPTMPEVMNMVRKELGADAVILNSKVAHHGGFLGLFKKKNIEVIAALDPQPKKPVQKPSLKDIKETSNIRPQSSTNDQEVLKEVKELRKWMEKTTLNQTNLFPDPYQKVYEMLIEQEVTKDIARGLMESIVPNPYDRTQTNDLDEVKADLRNELNNRLKPLNFNGISYRKKFIHFVGPTGVGKTTTIAKIAANSVIKDNRKVALITTDTYRIAAIDQLKTYSKILDIPLEIAYTIDDYRKAREKFKDYDLVLVDTAGRNFRDSKYVAELGKVVDFTEDLETYLVLSLTTKARDLQEVYEQFDSIPIKQVIFTKKDETVTYGPIINICLTNNIGVAYLTDGQDVPDDIMDSSINKINEMIVGE